MLNIYHQLQVMDQTSKTLSQKIKNQIIAPSNQCKISEILVKMGRVLAKKQSLNSERPVLVYDNRIWLGNYTYANDLQFLLDNKINKVVSCLQLPLSLHRPQIDYKQYILIDEKDQRFESLLEDFYRTINQSKENILVHCFSGKSRSVALMIYFIMRKERISYQESLHKLESLYPLAKPNKYFESVLKSKENLLDKLQIQQSIDLLGHSNQSPQREQNEPSKNQAIEDILSLKPSCAKDLSKECSNLLQEPISLSSNLLEKSTQHFSLQPNKDQQIVTNKSKSIQQFQNLIEIENNPKGAQTNLLDFKDDSENKQIGFFTNIESDKHEQPSETHIQKRQQQIQQRQKNEQTNLLQIQDQSEIMIENANFSQKKSKKGNKKKKK